MNDFEAWEKIIVKWKQVNRMKKLNQELYDILSGTILYLQDYSKKNDLMLPNREEINRMLARIHILMNQIDTPYQPPKFNMEKNNDKDPDNLPEL